MSAKPKPEHTRTVPPSRSATGEDEQAVIRRLAARGQLAHVAEGGGMTADFLEEVDRLYPSPADPGADVLRALLADRDAPR